jgi:thioredoxin reductase (NADPH)
VHKVDYLIVGGGPAGLTAAIYLSRFRRLGTLIDAGESRANLIPETHNYPGFAGISGPALLDRLRKQALTHGAQLETGKVLSIRRDPCGDRFIASTDKQDFAASAVLLATGLVDVCPVIEGLSHDRYAGPVRFCPICDGFEAIDKRVGVVGKMADAVRKALFIRTYTRDVLIFPIDESEVPIPAEVKDAGISIVGRPVHIERDDQTASIAVHGGGRHVVDVLYPALGCRVNSELGSSLGASCNRDGLIEVDSHQKTSLDGLYAAGDVVTDLHQISVATAHAAIAATDIHRVLPPNFRC